MLPSPLPRLAVLTGRKRGTPNKSTASLRALASDYTQLALEVLVAILRNPGAPPAAQIAAARELLDRGHGRPAQATTVSGPTGGPVPIIVMQEIRDDE
jgi:hypothetical protein